MGTKIDLTGHKFGRLTVIDEAPRKPHLPYKTFWNCECQCGVKRCVGGKELRRGNTKSCGCLQREITSKLRFKNGARGTPEYNTWGHMKRRCLLVGSQDYEAYGGRGVTICSQWRESFEVFLRDMGKKPNLKFSIERIDVNGNYDPSNCRWADAHHQAQNRRIKSTNTSGVTGVSFCKTLKRWGAHWVEISGATGSKSFSVKIYGYDEAFNLAKTARAEAIKRLNQQGAVYPCN
jgi:hypothetical protein